MSGQLAIKMARCSSISTMACCYSLNAVGGRIWQIIEAGQGRSSSDDIVEVLAREFAEVPREQLMTDVDNCLSDLEKKALVTAHGQAVLARIKRTQELTRAKCCLESAIP